MATATQWAHHKKLDTKCGVPRRANLKTLDGYPEHICTPLSFVSIRTGASILLEYRSTRCAPAR
jgi:hypothetical protein